MRFPIISNWASKTKQLSLTQNWEQIFSNYKQIIKTGGVQTSLTTDPSFYHPILKTCLNLFFFKNGHSIHAFVVKQGLFDSYTSIQNSLMDFYVKSGSLTSALTVFHSINTKDSISWNVIIHGHFSGPGLLENGLFLFRQARGTGVFEPNISTLVLVIQACKLVNDGLRIHGYMIRSGFCAVSSVQNSLMCFYLAKVGIWVARKVFDEMIERDVISWSVLIGGHAQNGEGHVALGLFHEMVSRGGVEIDGQIMVSTILACTSVGELGVGRLVHGFVICRGLNYDFFVGNSLVDMYSKCSDVDSAFEVFREMPYRNLVSWNSILSGFLHNEKHSEAIFVFDSMLKVDIQADEVTLVNLLQISKYLLDPLHCKSIHCAVVRRGYELNKLVMNSLVDVYAKCNHINVAWLLFSQMTEQDTITWSTMISGFTHCGMPEEAIAVFKLMNLAQEKPNAVTMLNLLEACSSSGELERSKWAHGIAFRNGLASEVTVGTAILDMYSKCGAIESSRRVFKQINEKNIVSWSAMIAAYGMNGFGHDALTLFAELKCQGLKPNPVTTLSVLSACSHGGLIEEGISLFEELVHDHESELSLEHYSCMVDLLGRAGKLESAVDLMESIPEGLNPGPSAWGALLSACRKYGNSELGVQAVSRVLELEPSNSAGYMLASGMYATGGSWVDAARMRLLVKERGVKVVAGYSLVHVNKRATKFVAGDRYHPLSDELCFVIEQLHGFLKLDNRNNENFLNS